MYEDEFELTFNLSGEEPQPEQAAQKPPVPPKPKAAAPVVDEPTRVMVLEKPQPAPQPEMPEPVQEEPEKTPASAVQEMSVRPIAVRSASISYPVKVRCSARQTAV